MKRYALKLIALFFAGFATLMLAIIPAVLISKGALVFIALLMTGWAFLGVVVLLVGIAHALWTEKP